MSAQEILDLWFRADTKISRERIKGMTDKWASLSPQSDLFTERVSVNLIYDDPKIKHLVRVKITEAGQRALNEACRPDLMYRDFTAIAEPLN